MEEAGKNNAHRTLEAGCVCCPPIGSEQLVQVQWVGWRGTRIRQTYQLTNTRAKCETEKLMLTWNKERAKVSAVKTPPVCHIQYLAVRNVVSDDFCPQGIWTALYLDMPLISTPVTFLWAVSISFFITRDFRLITKSLYLYSSNILNCSSSLSSTVIEQSASLSPARSEQMFCLSMINNHRNVGMKVGAADKAFMWVKLNISVLTAVNHRAMNIMSLRFSLISVIPAQTQSQQL